MGDLIDRHRPAMNGLAAEVFDVSTAEGITLEAFDAFDPAGYIRGAETASNALLTDDLVKWLAGQTKKRSGIWRDIAVRHRPTEVPTQYGPVVETAAKHGLRVPLIQELIRFIRELETGAVSMDEKYLTALDQMALAADSGRSSTEMAAK